MKIKLWALFQLFLHLGPNFYFGNSGPISVIWIRDICGHFLDFFWGCFSILICLRCYFFFALHFLSRAFFFIGLHFGLLISLPRIFFCAIFFWKHFLLQLTFTSTHGAHFILQLTFISFQRPFSILTRISFWANNFRFTITNTYFGSHIWLPL